MRLLGTVGLITATGFMAHLYAQAVSVLAVRGDVQTEQSPGNWVKLSTGTKLTEQQKIRVGEQSYVALVFPGNRAREIRQPGIYTPNQLITHKTTSDENPSTFKYTGYVLNQAIASGAGRASGKTLGAVTRSTMAPIPRTPIQSSFYADKVLLYWDRVPGSEGYVVQVIDDSGQILLSRELSAEQTSVELNLEGKVKVGPCYYWRVSTRRHPSLYSNAICFRVLPSDKAAALKKEEEAIRRGMDSNSALDWIILGGFYEQNGLHGYAWMAYNQALTIEPAVEGYLHLRDGLSQRATSVGE